MSHYDLSTGLIQPDKGEVPAVGDRFEFTVHRKVPCSQADFTYGLRAITPHDSRGCHLYDGHWTSEQVTAAVTEVIFWADNSIEVYGEGGLRQTLIAPHGDAC